MSPILQVKNLNVRFDTLKVLNDLSFDVEKGNIVAIIGPNGAGKTVLFRTLLGLIPYEGKIEWQPGVKIGYVPQKLSVGKDLPITVRDFLGFKNAPKGELLEALEVLGQSGHHSEHHLSHHLLDRKMGDLSGGELQRILIAYAVVGHPDVLLFDEPTAGVDIGGEETIYSILEKLRKKSNLSILLISHDLNVVYRYANQVLCINKEKICYGSPKDVLNSSALEQLYGTEVGVYHHGH
ncbi:MAG: metal ABC transporter ATP-binding protein [Patescibacteria group bacterium]